LANSGLPSQEELVQILASSVEEVFDAMFINISAGLNADDQAQPDPNSPGCQAEHGVDFEVVVCFTGALDGAVVLRCSNQGAEDIARGLLMMEEGDLELDEVKDALGECANMVTGSLKAKALDPVSDFKMGTPEVFESGLESRLNSNMIFQLTNGVMSAELWIDPRTRVL
jgi:CheY-specific phosphatase CheX